MPVAAARYSARTTEELQSLYIFCPLLSDNRWGMRVLHPNSATAMISG